MLTLDFQESLVEGIWKCECPVTSSKPDDDAGSLDAFDPAVSESLAADNVPSAKRVDLRPEVPAGFLPHLSLGTFPFGLLTLRLDGTRGNRGDRQRHL